MGKETLQRLHAEALALSETERAELALELMKSLDVSTERGSDSEWEGELMRRLAQIKAGTAEFVDRNELRRRMKEQLGRS